MARQRSLQGLAAAVEQQPRVWLPQHVAGGDLVTWLALLNVWAAGVGLFFFIVSSLRGGLFAWLVWLVVIGAAAVWATSAVLSARQSNKRRGWEVNFEQRTLTPIRLPGHSVITLGPDFSLGCYLGGEGGEERAWQLELRHARRGPVAGLALIHVRTGDPAEMKVLDRFVSRLAERLGIRRSGAPLPGLSDGMKPDNA